MAKSRKIPRTRRHIFNSPFDDYLGTTLSFQPPSGEHSRQTVHDFLPKIDGDIADIEADIAIVEARQAALNETLFNLYNEKEVALQYRKLHISLFPPVHDLPSDILLEIFQLVISQSLSNWNALDSKTGGPWFLGKICRRWRSLAWSSPSLWTGPFRIECSLHSLFSRLARRKDNVRNENTRKELLDGVLKRTGSAPIHISISTSHLSDKLSEGLAAHASHWGDISLVGSYKGLLEFLDHIHPADMLVSQLSKLTLGNQGPIVADQYQLSQLLRRLKVPSLRTLSITSPLEDVPSNAEFPWNRLTSLGFSFSHVNIDTVLRLLDSCTDLQTLDISCIDNHEPDVDTSHLVTYSLPRLSSLQVQCTTFLKYVRFPALEILNLRNRLMMPQHLDDLRRFMEESNMPLRTMTVMMHWEASRGQWKEALTLLSSVEDLRINTLDDSCEDALRSLIIPDDPTLPVNLPRLRRLVIVDFVSQTCWRSDSWMDAMFTVLFSRLSADSPPHSQFTRLQRVSIEWRNEFLGLNDADRVMFQRLVALRKEGLEIDVYNNESTSPDRASFLLILICIFSTGSMILHYCL